MVIFKNINVQGKNIFYREAGNINKPYLLLLHGFPTTSHMFRNLIPLLENSYHIIAPDYIGFGQSDSPDNNLFTYTFENLTKYVHEFIQILDIRQYYMYVFDYGAPIGFRLALQNPESILGIISQNGNVYEEGLGEKWKIRKAYWQNPTLEKRKQFETAFSKETIISQYTNGEVAGSVSPDGYSLDIYYSNMPGYTERQSDLILDYQTNIKLYPQFQHYLKQYQPKLLAVWGKNDSSFIYPGALAFKKDNNNSKVVLLPAGHFALETHYKKIAELILDFF